MNTINMVFYPEEGANNIKVAKMVKDHIAQIKKTLPAGYSILLSYDQTKFVSAEIHKVVMRTIFSMIILLIFVLLISRQFRYLVLILVSLTANLVIAAIFYYLLKIEIHLYSLAGITVSFGIIIDNSIVMIDHLQHQGNKKVFLAILAATLTTVGALSILFFLSEAQKINLVDFAEVIIVNLFVSLLIALFFIPALMDKLPLVSRKNKRYFRGKRRMAVFTRHYSRFILSLYRIRWAFILLLILGFGLPVYMLPEKIGKEEPFGREQKVEKEDNTWAALYNKTIGSSFYQQTLRPVTDKVLGGALRLFTENVFESSFYSSPQRTILYVTGGMPEGSTVQQLNEAVEKMENFINKYDEVQMYETSINNYRSGRITIYFKPEVENGSFPYFLKGALISKANNVGGLDWSVYGIGRGFSNALYSGYKNSQIILEGYNYDQLYSYANQLKKDLLKLSRVQEVDIIGGTNFYSSKILHEYFLDFNREQFGLNEVSLFQFYNYLQDRVYKRNLNRVYNHGEAQPVVLLSDRSEEFNVWDLKNEPVFIKDKMFKLGMLTSVEKKKTGNEIFKENQQYQLSVAYDFIGPGTFAQRIQKKKIEEMNAALPLGYKARSRSWWGWRRDDKSQYYLIFLVIVIIYFICSILLESLVQPLAIISMIPLAYIGVFLTFYLFDFNFDQGGFASFILLAGIVVNSGLYIINDYNNFCRERNVKKSMRLYLKAFNHKIIPVYLTILSTILGLFPFIWGGQKEVFWFAFAVGAMGGLIFSLLAVLVYLPLFMGLRNA
jgi:multidrug efflux pump subunit AcrB